MPAPLRYAEEAKHKEWKVATLCLRLSAQMPKKQFDPRGSMGMNGDESVPPGVGRNSAEKLGRRTEEIAKIAMTAKIAMVERIRIRWSMKYGA
jgi:hypothetical protein